MQSRVIFIVFAIINIKLPINSSLTLSRKHKEELDLKSSYKSKKDHRKTSNTAIYELVY